MKQIPTQKENPTGLHQKYVIKKIVEKKFPGGLLDDGLPYQLEDPHWGAEYFVLRLDTGGKDYNHIKACRIGMHAYADAIEPTIPDLAKDLRARYPLLP